MTTELDEINKLPAKERLKALKAFEEAAKKKKEKEQKKEKDEVEDLVARTIQELKNEEAEEVTVKKQQEKKEPVLEQPQPTQPAQPTQPKESLEQIAEEAPKKNVEQLPTYSVTPGYELEKHQEYALSLSKRPSSELHDQVQQLQDNQEQRGYLTEAETLQKENIAGALYQKNQSNYNPNERSKGLLNETEQMIKEMRDPHKMSRYHN